MLGDTLLDSSPTREPVLRGVHWLVSLAIGIAGFLIGYFGLPLIETPELKVLITQSTIIGVIFLFYGLILCYVYSDSKHLKLSTWPWLIIVALLNLVGFVGYLCYSAAKSGDWKRATLPVAYILEIIIIGITVIIPLIYTDALPKAQLMTFLVAPPPPPPPPPPPAKAPPVVVHKVSMADLMKAPTVIPRTIAKIKDQPAVQSAGVVGGVTGGVPGGQMGGVLGGIIGGVTGGPPPPPPPKPTTPQRIRVGGQVEAAKLIFKPTPEYPPLAKMARIQGTVRLEAIISKDGTIQDLKVLNGHPLLVKAALDAVKQWRYQPTLLNGEPVEVVTEIDVNFTLAG
ncbi:MAG TPA: energy transducer TonB [Terriglobia bacterium]|nr:energy transducer TonB [Terriglobia bacterium]